MSTGDTPRWQSFLERKNHQHQSFTEANWPTFSALPRCRIFLWYFESVSTQTIFIPKTMLRNTNPQLRGNPEVHPFCGKPPASIKQMRSMIPQRAFKLWSTKNCSSFVKFRLYYFFYSCLCVVIVDNYFWQKSTYQLRFFRHQLCHQLECTIFQIRSRHVKRRPSAS